jgi:enoyl-CoA hydratase
VPEVTRGLVARGGGSFKLPRRIPMAIAMELLLTGAPIDAAKAERFGLVNRLTPDGAALAGALELGQLIALNAPLAVVASKRVAVESSDWTTDTSFVRQRQYFDPVFASEDAREGALAFAERREPSWRGR